MSLNEFDFIRRYLHAVPQDAAVLQGIGDDAALVRPAPGEDWCFSTDMLLAGRHFFADDDPADVAHKVLAVNVSDMAAMGARPRWALLGAALPGLDEAWLAPFCQTLSAQAAAYGVALIGGDTTRGERMFALTMAGTLPQGQALRRSGARAGDDVWVSGLLGSAAAGLQHLLGRIRLPENLAASCVHALRRPEPRVALGQALLPLAHAALDVSDGLLQDLGHILRASGVGAEVAATRVPCLPPLKDCLTPEQYWPLLLAGGDDYELLFTAAPAQRGAIAALGAALDVPLARIGRIRAETGLHCRDAQGRTLTLDRQGYDHFA